MPTLVRLVLALTLFATLAHAEPDKGKPIAAVAGEVLAQDGQPIEGARVAIWTAYPRQGPAYYCPSCYRDCGRSVNTDAKGRFTIDRLDDSLKFTLLITRDGFSPKLHEKYNPADPPLAGEHAIKLTPRDWSQYPPSGILQGRVIDQHANPVPHAVIDGFGVRSSDGGGRFGQVSGLDPIAVANDKGEFRIGYRTGCAAMDLTISARAFTLGVFPELATGDTIHTLKLIEGATVTGRLIHEGQPLPDTEVAIYSTNRDIFNHPREDLITTDRQGVFSFFNVRPNAEYWVYTKMASAKRLDAAFLRRVRVGADGTILDLADLLMAPAFGVSGRIIVEGGAPIPANTRVFLSSDAAWDSQELLLSQDGRFAFSGIPAGKYELSITNPGRTLTVSPKNLSCLPGSGSLTGRVDSDIEGLEVLVAPPDPLQQPARTIQAWEKPLEGIE